MSAHYLYYRFVDDFYFSYLNSIETQNALRRQRIAAKVTASRIACENLLRKARIENDIFLDNSIHRSRIEDEIAIEAAKRSYLTSGSGLIAQRLADQIALRRSRIAVQIQADQLKTENIVRRSRIEAEIAADPASEAFRRSRIQAQLIAKNAIRRSRVEAQLEVSRIRRLYCPYF